VISFASAVGIVLVSIVLFDLPVRGSWVVLLLTLALYLIGALPLGLMISRPSGAKRWPWPRAASCC
jgi:hypothetical protein